MGDFVKAVFIGALIFFTAALILPAIGLAAPFAGLFGIESVLLSAAIGGAITGAVSFLLAPSMELGDANARLNLSIDPNAFAKWCIGETPLATDIVFAATHGSNDQFVSHIIAGAAHKIHAYGSLFINDASVVISSGEATGDWADGLWVQRNLGTETQAAFTDIDADDNFNPDFWPDTADGAGVAHYRLRWGTDSEKMQEEGSIPTRITQIAQCLPVYDPRLDPNFGGAGIHDPLDVSTWNYIGASSAEIGTNWALVVLSYLLGWRKEPEGAGPLFNIAPLQFGVGIHPDDIDMEQAIAAANVCDTLVDGIPKYRVGGIFSLTQDHEQITGQLEAAIGGKVAVVGGKYYIWAPHDDLIPFNRIDEVDLIRDVGVEFIPSTPLESLFNTGRGRYINPDNLYQPSPYAEIVEDAFVTEDGRVRSLEHDFAIIQDESIAQRVIRYLVRRSRFGATWRFALGPKGLIFRPFTVTTLNIKETNFVDTLVRIVDMTISAQGVILMTVIEEDASIYDITPPLEAPPGQNDPGNQLPAPGLYLRDANVHNTRVDPLVCTAGVRVNANGRLEFSTAGGAWFEAPRSLRRGPQWIGELPLAQDYWARATLNSGGPLTTGVLDTWEILDATREYTIEQTGVGVANANLLLELSDVADGSNLLESGIIDLQATVDAAPPFTLTGTGALVEVQVTPTVEILPVPMPGFSTGDLLVYITCSCPGQGATFAPVPLQSDGTTFPASPNNWDFGGRGSVDDGNGDTAIRVFFRRATGVPEEDEVYYRQDNGALPPTVLQMLCFSGNVGTGANDIVGGFTQVSQPNTSAFPVAEPASSHDDKLDLIVGAKSIPIDAGTDIMTAPGEFTMGVQINTGDASARLIFGWAYAVGAGSEEPDIGTADWGGSSLGEVVGVGFECESAP